ncbi:hypothetical protein BDZ89DRAFT_185558 [Hymenopellis radicata]|nr:hypothetical protein BDZ89DRAFT_185558 [Hymenopellis radicata]
MSLSPRSAVSVSSTSPTTLSPMSRIATSISPNRILSLSVDVVSIYLQSPENCHLVVNQEDYDALIAFLVGDSDSLQRIQSSSLGSIYRTAYLRNGRIMIGKTRLIPAKDLALVLASLPFRYNLKDMVLDVADRFSGVPESLVNIWHAYISRHHDATPISSASCAPLLSELPAITVAHFLRGVDNCELLVSREVYDITVEALSRSVHSPVSPLFRFWKEGVSLCGGRLFVGTRVVIPVDQLPAILESLPSTASENQMVGLSMTYYCGVPEALIREWHSQLSQYHQNKSDDHAAQDKPLPRLESGTPVAGTRRVIRKREEGREDAIVSAAWASGSQDLHPTTHFHVDLFFSHNRAIFGPSNEY